jgi:hypothetical protein
MLGRRTGAWLTVAMLIAVAVWPGRTPPARADGPWSSLELDTRRGSTVITVGDRVLIAGGNHRDEAAGAIVQDDRVDVYDGIAGTWTQAKLSVPRSRPVARTVGNQAVFIGGSLEDAPRGAVPTDAIDIYDGATDTWRTAQLTFKTADPNAFAVGTQVVILPGHSGEGRGANVYDSTTGDVTALQPVTDVSSMAPYVVAEGVAVMAGRHSSDGSWNVEEPLNLYDSAKGEWSTIQVPTPRSQVGVEAVGSMILFAGGKQDEQLVDAVDILDVRTRTWNSAKLSTPQVVGPGVVVGRRLVFTRDDRVNIFDADTGAWTSAVAPTKSIFSPNVVGDRLVYRSGTSSGPSPETPVHIFDVNSSTWQKSSLSVPRNSTGVATIGTRVLFAGGGKEAASRSPDTVFNTVDIFDLATGTSSTGTLQRAREVPRVATVGGKVLFIGGVIHCKACAEVDVGVIIDIYDPGE